MDVVAAPARPLFGLIGIVRSNAYMAGVAASTFVYLWVDFFIQVKDFAQPLRARSFWALWFCTSV
jgi:hypothetical protein